MRKTLYFLNLVTVLSLSAMSAGAQGMAVNTSGAAANTSAILDVSGTSQGILIPRMTGAQRTAITVGTAQTGLIVYQTDGTAGFYYYDGSTWVSVSTPGGAAGGDLSGSYPNPTISSSAGNDIVTAINASAGSLSGTKLATASVSVNALSATGRTTSNFLRGDNTWQTISAGGTTLSAGSTGGQVYLTGSGGTVPTTPVTVSGDATLAATGAFTLATTTVSAGSYGSSTLSPQVTVDAKGRITGVTNQTITIGGSSLGSISATPPSAAVSFTSTSPTAITAADQIYIFKGPASASQQNYLTLPSANSFAKGYTIYIYQALNGFYWNLGPAGTDHFASINGNITAGSFINLYQMAICISDGVGTWYGVATY